MTPDLAPASLLKVESGQQTGSERLKSASLNGAESIKSPRNPMNRAIPRPSSLTVVTVEAACRAGPFRS